MIPFSPRVIWRTSAGYLRMSVITGVYPTMLKTTSEFWATSMGLFASLAPLATRGSHLLRVLLY